MIKYGQYKEWMELSFNSTDKNWTVFGRQIIRERNNRETHTTFGIMDNPTAYKNNSKPKICKNCSFCFDKNKEIPCCGYYPEIYTTRLNKTCGYFSEIPQEPYETIGNL